MTSTWIPSTSADVRFTDSVKHKFLVETYHREERKHNPKSFNPTSPVLTRQQKKELLNSMSKYGKSWSPVKRGSSLVMKKKVTTQDLCRPVQIDGSRRPLPMATPGSGRQRQLVPESWRDDEEQDNDVIALVRRRTKLEHKLRAIRAELSEQEKKVEKQMTKHPERVPDRFQYLTQKRPHSSAASSRSRRTNRSQRSTWSRASRAQTPASTFSVANSFSWDDAFETTNHHMFLKAEDSALRRTLLTNKPKAPLDSKYQSLVQVTKPLHLRDWDT